jgi:hypothetical protein
MNLDLSHLHYVIVKEMISKGYAPSIEDLEEIFNRSKEDVLQCLKDLEEYHGVVLHPKTSQIWIIHPFSTSPTNFWVQSKKGQWWGNCAWCSLGIAAIINEDVTITTTLGGEYQQIQFHIQDGQIKTNHSLFVHFPIPMRNAWDNVTYTCSLMQLFSSESDVDDWCQRHHISKGDVQPIHHIWKFAQKWYGNHLREDWTKWTNEQAKDIFQQFHFTNQIWNIPQTKSTF